MINKQPLLKYNKEKIGLITGLILPVITIFVFFLVKNPDSFKIFINQIIGVNIYSELISVCVVPNLLLFFIFIWTNRMLSARGVIGATFIYAIIILILKYFI
ncbi:MAG: hypothetical protein JXR51_02665 [Bacteroidales bacterium]|nr:hypothetical protein [Bacteroidales bacterium]MBN2756051.1 hypothetical protein [Bacteroidales bacterium]